MKWAYNIRRKGSAALLLGAVFVLLFVTNLIDSNNVMKLGTSFSSVYEDRLLVESYIYRISENLFRKKIMLDTGTNDASATRIKPMVEEFNKSISGIIVDYEKTRLTEDEILYFRKLKENVTKLAELENVYLSCASGLHDRVTKQMIDIEFNEASRNLDQLSAIQVSEGKLLNEHSKKIVAGSFLLTKLEISILVTIGLIVIVLVFESSTSMLTKHKQSLN